MDESSPPPAMNTVPSEADMGAGDSKSDTRITRVRLQQVQSSFQVIWLIVLLLSASRWICYLSFLGGADVLAELLLCSVPSLTIVQLTIATVALSWRVGNTKEGWQRFRKRTCALVAIEMAIIALLAVYVAIEGNRTLEIGLLATPEGAFLGGVLIPAAMLLLHAIPVYLMIDYFRRQGFELVNTKLPELPREKVSWRYQFRIRDLMLVTLLASILLATLQYMDLAVVGNDLRHVFSSHVLAIAVGILGMLLLVARTSFQGSGDWFLQILAMMMFCFLISIGQVAFGMSNFGIIPLVIGHLFVNVIYLAILVIVWKILESSGWRVVREGDL